MNISADLNLFNQLYIDYRQSFVGFANSYTRDQSVAEDITSEAFMIYWENRTKLIPNSNIPAYILTIIKNKCLNYIKSKDLEQRSLGDIKEHSEWETELRIFTLEACNPQELFSTEIQQIVESTLTNLAPKTQEIYKLSRHKNKTHKEIAQQLGITTKGVEFHITKALTALRNNLKDYILYLIVLFLC